FHGRLVVERVDVAGTTVHVQEDDTPGLGRQVRLLRGQRADKLVDAIGGDGLAAEEVVAEQTGERDGRETAAGFPEVFAPRASAEVAAVPGHGANPRRQSR